MGGGAAALNVVFTASAQGWPYICHAHSPGYLPGERRKEKKERRREGKWEGERSRGAQRERFFELPNHTFIMEVVLSSRLWYYLILAKMQMQNSACPQNSVALE